MSEWPASVDVPPFLCQEGLAIYKLGAGEPVFLMPSPHNFNITSCAESSLSQILIEMGRQVITFDPPGAYRSTRPAQIGISEMLACTQETLATLGVFDHPLDVVGHSMAGLCSLAWTLEHPERVHHLVLLNTISDGPAIRRRKGMPWNFRLADPNFWSFVYNGLRITLKKGNLAVHKRLVQLIWQASYVDSSLIPALEIHPEDFSLPAPVRDQWPLAVRKLDFSQRLGEIRAPTLICAGRHDPQAPILCSQELARGIIGAKLQVFERSGHYPFLEERHLFIRVLSQFLE